MVSESLVVMIIQDEINEKTENFSARIIIPLETQQLGVKLGSPSTLNIAIIDDDRKST